MGVITIFQKKTIILLTESSVGCPDAPIIRNVLSQCSRSIDLSIYVIVGVVRSKVVLVVLVDEALCFLFETRSIKR